MRGVAQKMGQDPKLIEPLVPVDLVVDHSVQIDHYGSKNALDLNMKLEFKRNEERYQFMKWGMQAFDTFKVVPPGIGIVHQVNLEYLARGVHRSKDGIYYPDTLVGTDSHTTMINGIGVVGWGVGGIEAEAGMLGQPVYFLTPDVVGVHLKGRLHPAVTATDLVLTITEMLRKAKVVGKFVEFFGEGTASLALPDRATIANMAPEYGATMGFFPVDEKTIEYFRGTGRSADEIAAFEAYFKAQQLFGIPRAGAIDYSQVLELDLSSVMPSLAGPKRPQDRIDLDKVKRSFSTLFSKPVAENGFAKKAEDLGKSYKAYDGTALKNGDVLIAAITSCTNTSNPGVLLAAGLLAKKAVELGLSVKPHIKTSLAPGSRVVTEYLKKAGLLPYLEKLGFYLAGYGCTTCIGNAGPLAQPIEEAIVKNDLVCAAVLSGNRNFEARIHPNIRANFLAAPPLVVVYAIAGSMLKDLRHEPIGKSKDGQDVYIGHIWPTREEIEALRGLAMDAPTFRRLYSDLADANPLWKKISAPGGQVYSWPASTYIAEPPFFRDFDMQPGTTGDIRKRARPRHLRRLGDHRPHLAGGLDQADLAGGHVPAGERRLGGRLQQLRRAPRQPRGHDARHVRQRAHQEPDAARHRGRRDALQGRDDADLRRRDDLHGRRHADRGLRRRGVRHRQLARLGGQGHAAARREGGDRAQLRAHPPLEPGRHGRAAAAVHGRRLGRVARPQGRRDHRHRRARRPAPAAGDHAGDHRVERRTPRDQGAARASTPRSRSTTTGTAASCRTSCVR